MAALSISNLTKSFGGLRAVNNCSFEVEANSIVGIMGPNGSGKTTIFNLISGFYKPDSGTIVFEGEDITDMKTHRIARKGIGRTFQITKVFKKLTVLENLIVSSKLPVDSSIERASEVLKTTELLRLKDEQAENLSYGQQKLLEFARVLMVEPKLFLLDEPAAGINPILRDKLMNQIKRLRVEDNKTFVIVEHSLNIIKDVCDKVIVLSEGEKIAEGPYNEIIKDEAVLKSYFLRLAK